MKTNVIDNFSSMIYKTILKTFLSNRAFWTENQSIVNKTISEEFASLQNLKGIYMSKLKIIKTLQYIELLSYLFLIDASLRP